MSECKPRRISQKRERSQIIRVTRRPGTQYDGLLTIGHRRLHCKLGRGGVTALKREGDGCTPRARMQLLSLRFRADKVVRPPGCYGARAVPLRATDGWCDDAGDARYNRPVDMPFRSSHEALWRDDDLYDVIGILNWNVRSRSLGRGSAIFLHLARPDGGPTAGCIALSRPDLVKFLGWLRPGATFWVV